VMCTVCVVCINFVMYVCQRWGRGVTSTQVQVYYLGNYNLLFPPPQELLLSWLPEIDVEDWQRNTEYTRRTQVIKVGNTTKDVMVVDRSHVLSSHRVHE